MENNKQLREDLINKLEDKLEYEIDFFTNDDITPSSKKARLENSLAVNKFVNTIVQMEALKQRTRENEIKNAEYKRLLARFKTKEYDRESK